jgi:hypothetical protein
MTKLLIQESPLTFQPSLAVAIGLNEAIVLQQVHYWLANSKNKGYEQDGYKWVYNTYAEWRETNFPFWSENTIQRTFANLEEAGLVVSIQPMKSKYDRTKYYRIDYPKLEVFDDPNLVRSLNESEITAENTTNHYQPKGIEAKIMAGLPVTEGDMPSGIDACNAFESAMGVNPWPWASNKTWEKFARWVEKEFRTDSESFARYAAWRKSEGKYNAMSNNKIRQNPEMFMDTGWPTFLASVSMYGKKDPQPEREQGKGFYA